MYSLTFILDSNKADIRGAGILLLPLNLHVAFETAP